MSVFITSSIAGSYPWLAATPLHGPYGVKALVDTDSIFIALGMLPLFFIQSIIPFENTIYRRFLSVSFLINTFVGDYHYADIFGSLSDIVAFL